MSKPTKKYSFKLSTMEKRPPRGVKARSGLRAGVCGPCKWYPLWEKYYQTCEVMSRNRPGGTQDVTRECTPEKNW